VGTTIGAIYGAYKLIREVVLPLFKKIGSACTGLSKKLASSEFFKKISFPLAIFKTNLPTFESFFSLSILKNS